MSDTSYEVRFWKIEVRANRRSAYRVLWIVAGQRFSQSFMSKPLADSFRSQLIMAASKGEAFDVESGLPVSLLRKRTDVSENAKQKILTDNAKRFYAWQS